LTLSESAIIHKKEVLTKHGNVKALFWSHHIQDKRRSSPLARKGFAIAIQYSLGSPYYNVPGILFTQGKLIIRSKIQLWQRKPLIYNELALIRAIHYFNYYLMDSNLVRSLNIPRIFEKILKVF